MKNSLLNFCCWSTIQLNCFAQHLLARTTTFLYAESDTLESVADHLRGDGWDSWPNPEKTNLDSLSDQEK